MAYDLFLIDLDDTLLDFRASERLAFQRSVAELNHADKDALYESYRTINKALWEKLERCETTLEQLKIDRFRELSDTHALGLDAPNFSERYLDFLASTAVLNEHAAELCEWLGGRGEIGIVTNGFYKVQTSRIRNSALAPHISFICVSDLCGYSKPDARIFEHSSAMAKKFAKANTLVLGDRLEADILGAKNFGVDSCWFNPHGKPRGNYVAPTYEIAHLSGLRPLLETLS